jgi:ribosome-associated protein
MLRKAAVRPKHRRKTKPTTASKERRLDSKRRRSHTKRGRLAAFGDDDHRSHG